MMAFIMAFCVLPSPICLLPPGGLFFSEEEIERECIGKRQIRGELREVGKAKLVVMHCMKEEPILNLKKE